MSEVLSVLRREVSGAIGVVGGLVDVVVALLVLQQNSMEMGGAMMTGSRVWASYFLLALGAIVLMTGTYVLTSKTMKHHSATGLLMLFYGVIMLVLGAGMIGQLFGFMMRGSIVSGITMIFLGLVMLYSGLDMTKSAEGKMM
jgi:drug/metabolite transporter (DMT)-like permease